MFLVCASARAQAPAPAASGRTGYVYLGKCDKHDGWHGLNFAGEWFEGGGTGCIAAIHMKGAIEDPKGWQIVSLRGMKVRGGAPKGGAYAEEISRIKKGDAVRLLETECMCGDDPLPGPKVIWGKIRF